MTQICVRGWSFPLRTGSHKAQKLVLTLFCPQREFAQSEGQKKPATFSAGSSSKSWRRLAVAEAAASIRQCGTHFEAQIIHRGFFTHDDFFALRLTLSFFSRTCDIDGDFGFDF